MRGRPAISGLAAPCCAAAAVAALAGCGNGGTFKNNPRPPAPIVITAAITPTSVAVSPAKFGAGPISLVVTNQTERSQRLAISQLVNGGQQRIGETGPINPNDTASLKSDLDPGSYTVTADGGPGIKPAKVHVGHERPSAQNDLLQP